MSMVVRQARKDATLLLSDRLDIKSMQNNKAHGANGTLTNVFKVARQHSISAAKLETILLLFEETLQEYKPFTTTHSMTSTGFFENFVATPNSDVVPNTEVNTNAMVSQIYIHAIEKFKNNSGPSVEVLCTRCQSAFEVLLSELKQTHNLSPDQRNKELGNVLGDIFTVMAAFFILSKLNNALSITWHSFLGRVGERAGNAAYMFLVAAAGVTGLAVYNQEM
jgi:hypothetical protein